MQVQHKELHRVVSTAIIHKDGQYLLIKRSPSKKVYPGKWTLPGGGLEIDDYVNSSKTTPDAWYFAIEKSLRREVREETNLEFGRLEYLLDIALIRPDGIPVVVLSFFADYKSGEVKLDDENIDYAWATFEEARNYDLIPGILNEIEMVDKIKKGASLEEVEFKYKEN